MINMKNYINYSALDGFRRFMSTRGKVEPLLAADIFRTAGGSYRRPLIQSSKFTKPADSVYVYGMYLAPSKAVKGLNTCPWAGECASGCIAYTGNLSAENAQKKQSILTRGLYYHTELFLIELLNQIYKLGVKHMLNGESVMIRLNSTSDLPFYQLLDFAAIVRDFQGVKGFYDYTKAPNRARVVSDVYHLTYSYSEKSTPKQAAKYSSIAFVLPYKQKKILLKRCPDTFVDGDKHDVRAMDDGRFVLLGVKGIGQIGTVKQTQYVSDDFVMHMSDVCDVVEAILDMEAVK